MDIQHILKQAELGEFALLKKHAKGMTAEKFAESFNGELNYWGKDNYYKCVEIEGIEYLWVTETGEYDGWNKKT